MFKPDMKLNLTLTSVDLAEMTQTPPFPPPPPTQKDSRSPPTRRLLCSSPPRDASCLCCHQTSPTEAAHFSPKHSRPLPRPHVIPPRQPTTQAQAFHFHLPRS